jgi:general secretion pathway protein A
MYEAFYGLTRRPFENTPNPEFFFASKQHREALAALVYGIKEAKGFMLVTGDVGAGKTFLIHSLKYEMEEDDLIIVEAASPWISPEELLDALPEKLGMKREPEWNSLSFQERLKEKLKKRHAQGRRIVVIVDEAQQLPERTLEGIRLLSNYETENAKLIQIILLGQPELSDMLARHSMRQVRQRIVLSRELSYLNLAESKGYIEHRLKLSGQPASLFTDESIALIYRVSQGAPRLINLVCDNCLITGYAHSARMITPQIVREAIKELPMVAPQIEALNAAPETNTDAPVPRKRKAEDTPAPPVSEPAMATPKRAFTPPAAVKSLPVYGIWVLLIVVALLLGWYGSSLWNSASDERTAAADTMPQTQPQPAQAAVMPVAEDTAPRYVPVPDMSAPADSQTAGDEAEVPPVVVNEPSHRPDQGAGAELPLYMQMRSEIGVASVREDVESAHRGATPSEPVAIEPVQPGGIAQTRAPVVVGSFDGYVRSQYSAARNGSGQMLAYPFEALALQLVNTVTVPSGSTISQTARKQYGTWNETVQDMVQALNPAFGGDLNNVDTRLGINLPEIKKAHLIVNQSGSGWYAYAGTLSSRSRANFLYESLKKLGEPVDMVTRQAGGHSVYRVYIGPYQDPQQVLAVLDNMRLLHMPFLN